MEIYDLITCRHSERRYAKEKVSMEKIEKIIDAGLAAPSGMNTQPWHFTVIQDEIILKELVENCKNNFLNSQVDWRIEWANSSKFNPFYDPNLIIVISNKLSVKNSNEDCCFAIQNMTLMAESLGLSSCIIEDICWAINKSNQEKYGIPKEFECFMCLSIGYALKKNVKKKIFDYSKVNYIN